MTPHRTNENRIAIETGKIEGPRQWQWGTLLDAIEAERAEMKRRGVNVDNEKEAGDGVE